MNLDTALSGRLETLRREGLYRQPREIFSPQGPRIQIAGRELLNFSSNDYLGLANEPALKEAAIAAVRDWGAGSGASRLVCGSLSAHCDLENALADFKGTAAALAFSSGYATALGTVCALAGKGDVIILDKLVHACIVDAARLSGATLRVFPHNDLEGLEAVLRWASTPRATPSHEAPPGILIITESVFSMDGDQAPLREIVALKEKYGAWLMLDEAHATGLYGDRGRGLAAAQGLAGRIEVQMGTLGKAIGSAGGYICGSRVLVDFLLNRARSFIFSTAPVPAAAGAATAGLRLIQGAEGDARRLALWQRVAELTQNPFRDASRPAAAIIPLPIGPEEAAVQTSAALLEQGLFVPAIRYPAVARGSARLRVTVSAAHTSAEIAQLTGALKQLNLRFGPAGERVDP